MYHNTLNFKSAHIISAVLLTNEYWNYGYYWCKMFIAYQEIRTSYDVK